MKRYGLEVTVQTDPLESTSVSESASALLLRSVRELPINTVKHAAVKQASIRIPAQMDTFRSSWGTRAARILPLPRTDWLRELVLLSLRDSAFSLSGNE